MPTSNRLTFMRSTDIVIPRRDIDNVMVSQIFEDEDNKLLLFYLRFKYMGNRYYVDRRIPYYYRDMFHKITINDNTLFNHGGPNDKHGNFYVHIDSHFAAPFSATAKEEYLFLLDYGVLL